MPAADPNRTASLMETLSLRFRTPLRRFFGKKAVPSHEIDDLVQEVFLRLANQQSFESTDRLEAYLFKSASNLLKDRHRRMTHRAASGHETYEEELHGSAQASYGPERVLLGTQALEQLIAALYELPERTRVIFTLYHIEDMPHREIAQRLGIAISTIEKHMARAGAHLVKRLEGLK